MDEVREFVKKAHKNQHYKGGVPYWFHLNRVANLLATLLKEAKEETPQNKEIITAAFLHDVLEDTQVSEQEIENLFGSQVKDIVKELTDKNSEVPESPAYTEKMQGASEEARLIKLADLYDNITTATRRLNENGFDWTSNFFVPRIDKMSKAMLGSEFNNYPETAKALKQMVRTTKHLLLSELPHWQNSL